MQHLEDIKSLVRTLQLSQNFHALVIESPPGWAKSSTVEALLKGAGIDFMSLGSFSTPLNLYNSICENPQRLLLLDDCAGLFGEAPAMAILKAATWSSVGSLGGRRVTWGSSSGRAKQPNVDFTGKIILLTNAVPMGKDMDAFISRTLYLKLSLQPDDITNLLLLAAKSTEHYDNIELSSAVASHLLGTFDLSKLNLRSLKMAYEIAKTNPVNWKSLLERLLPSDSAKGIASKLVGSDIPVEAQAREFTRLTGLSRRTFFNYRQYDALTTTPDKVQVAQVCATESGVAGG